MRVTMGEGRSVFGACYHGGRGGQCLVRVTMGREVSVWCVLPWGGRSVFGACYHGGGEVSVWCVLPWGGRSVFGACYHGGEVSVGTMGREGQCLVRVTMGRGGQCLVRVTMGKGRSVFGAWLPWGRGGRGELDRYRVRLP